MIVSNRRHMFEFSQSGVLQSAAFGCAIITAPEGIFKRCSTVFQAFDGAWATARNKQLVAKAMLNPRLSKNQRAMVHNTFLTHLDALGNHGVGLPRAIDEVFAKAKGKKLIVDSINKVHDLLNEPDVDYSPINDLLDANRRGAEADAKRLLTLLKVVAERIGEAPVGRNEKGEVFVHPELARELKEPGNEMLSDMLIMGARANTLPPLGY